MSKQTRKYDWLVVPGIIAEYGYAPGEDTGWPAFGSRREAEAEIEEAVARWRDARPKTGDGADYCACRLADAQNLRVIHRRNLRRRSYEETRRLHYEWPQFYPAP